MALFKQVSNVNDQCNYNIKFTFDEMCKHFYDRFDHNVIIAKKKITKYSLSIIINRKW